jgi:hypothetical protein
MKLFISWSGDRSRIVAEALRSWIPDIIQAVKPWVSGVDIRAGTRWSREVEQQLLDTRFGILCLTKENQTAPWLVFEAGALAKSVEGSAVCPYLIGMTPGELLDGPLTAFQAKRADREDTFDLIGAINSTLPESERLGEGQLQKAFTRWWPDLESVLTNLPSSSAPPVQRSASDIAEELLTSTRQIARQMTEALTILAGGSPAGTTVGTAAGPVDHLRISGDPAKVEELVSELQRGSFGGRVLQRQRYADGLVAVNVGADSSGHYLDTDRFRERSVALGVVVTRSEFSFW